MSAAPALHLLSLDAIVTDRPACLSLNMCSGEVRLEMRNLAHRIDHTMQLSERGSASMQNNLRRKDSAQIIATS